MNFVNETKVEAGWTLGFERDGRELLIVAVKATFSIPAHGEKVSMAQEQVPLTEADEFTGEPGYSATLYETDYAHRKPYCDVLLNGSAYAPDKRPRGKVTVALQVRSMKKSFRVIGDRVWEKYLFINRPSPPKLFLQLPISYDRAFGGTDVDEDNPKKVKTYLKNPIGVGYYPISKNKNLAGKPLSNTEELGCHVTSVSGKYRPMSFGPIGRNFQSRISYAGTYDQKWLDNQAPFWPDDFDYRYFQSAPPDQQIPYPQGGEKVVLKNLSPQSITIFELPRLAMPILFIPYRGKDKQLKAVIDTVLIEPDKAQFMLTWRASLPLRQNLFEIKRIIAGEMPKAWYRARKYGNKPHYKSIDEYIKARKAGGSKH